MSNEGGNLEAFKRWMVKNIFILLNDFLLHPSSLPKMKTNSQEKKIENGFFFVFFFFFEKDICMI